MGYRALWRRRATPQRARYGQPCTLLIPARILRLQALVVFFAQVSISLCCTWPCEYISFSASVNLYMKLVRQIRQNNNDRRAVQWKDFDAPWRIRAS
jgi:hypothetical protein